MLRNQTDRGSPHKPATYQQCEFGQITEHLCDALKVLLCKWRRGFSPRVISQKTQLAQQLVQRVRNKHSPQGHGFCWIVP